MSPPPIHNSTHAVIHCDYRSTGLAHQLSNLCNYEFELDGIKLGSMEAFLQSIKFVTDAEKQLVYPLYGVACFRAGQKGNAWKMTQTLQWNGVWYQRSSNEYQQLLERAYDALCAQSKPFRQALRQSEGRELRHDFGKTNMQDSVLTRIEYIYQLYRLRAVLP